MLEKAQWRTALCMALSLAAALLLFAPRGAIAATRAYWGDAFNGTISWNNLDGSAAGSLDLGTSSPATAFGLALDASAGTMYWVDISDDKIRWAALDGSGSGDLNIGAAPFGVPAALAIDVADGKIYWADNTNSAIGWAKLDGSGGGQLDTGSATVDGPVGLVLDVASRRIYWTNNTGNKISSVSLDNPSDGGDLAVQGATVDGPEALAIDPIAGRLYWSNVAASSSSQTISSANLDGSGGADLVSGDSVSGALGLAVDPFQRKLYWTRLADAPAIYSANLDGSDAGPVPGIGAQGPAAFLALLNSPTPAASLTPSGAAVPGSVISCGKEGWAPDLPAAGFYRAPTISSYSWSRNGAPIAGATDSVYTAFAPGSYRCTGTASNAAGTATQTSNPLVIPDQAAAVVPAPELSLRVRPRRLNAAPGHRATLRAVVRNRGDGAAAGVRLCVKLPKKSRRAVKAPKCKRLGAIAPGGVKKRKLKVKVKGAAAGTYKLRVVVRGAGGAKPATVRLRTSRARRRSRHH